VRVVADTNVLISALLFGGLSEQIFLAGLRGEIQLITSLPLLKELERILKGKFKFDVHLVNDILDEVKDIMEIVEISSRINVIHPEEDNRVLECAVDGRAEIIVTGDTKHILPLKEYRGIKILSPVEFTKRLPLVFP
jgi:putative PIN family toxin of toxin-antitoxin system